MISREKSPPRHFKLTINNINTLNIIDTLFKYIENLLILVSSDLTSTNIPNGSSWQTIATIDPQSAQSALTDQRSAYAMFEVVDRSNPGTQYKFTDNLSFS